MAIRVDSKTNPFGVSGHMVNTSTQTKWNGLLGDLQLAAHDPAWIQQVRVVPDVSRRTATVTLSIGNITDVPQTGRVLVSATPFNVPEAKGRNPIVVSHAFTATPGGATLSLTLPMGADALLWDEFHPALYRLVVNSETEAAEGIRFRPTYRDEFGLREFKTKNSQFIINGRTTMLRGKHDAQVFPLLGHTAMDLAEWTRVLTIAKSYGINQQDHN